MTFSHPWVLLFLIVPILLCVWEATRRGQLIALPFDHGDQRKGTGLRLLVLPATWLPALLLAVVILILSGPSRLEKPKRARELTNIEFCLDVSGSMTSPFGEGSQYDAAMEAIKDFTSRRKGDAFGLTIFGNEVLRWVPLTRDLSAIQNATPFLRPEDLPHHFGGTEIGKALRFCHQTLIEPGEGDRLLILLSDGQSADLPGRTARDIGAELAEDDIVLYSIHIGNAPVPGELYDLTRPTGGMVFPVDNPEALQTVFRHIDRMQPVKLGFKATSRLDAFGLFATAGLVILGFYGLALFGWRYTPW